VVLLYYACIVSDGMNRWLVRQEYGGHDFCWSRIEGERMQLDSTLEWNILPFSTAVVAITVCAIFHGTRTTMVG